MVDEIIEEYNQKIEKHSIDYNRKRKKINLITYSLLIFVALIFICLQIFSYHIINHSLLATLFSLFLGVTYLMIKQMFMYYFYEPRYRAIVYEESNDDQKLSRMLRINLNTAKMIKERPSI